MKFFENYRILKRIRERERWARVVASNRRFINRGNFLGGFLGNPQGVPTEFGMNAVVARRVINGVQRRGIEVQRVNRLRNLQQNLRLQRMRGIYWRRMQVGIQNYLRERGLPADSKMPR